MLSCTGLTPDKETEMTKYMILALALTACAARPLSQRPTARPTVSCSSGRSSERVAVVTCRVVGHPDEQSRAAVARLADFGAVREALAIGATWIQKMNADSTLRRDPESCETNETSWSVLARSIAIMNRQPQTSDTNCRTDYAGGINCSHTERPRVEEPRPRYETVCSEGAITGLDGTITYELLDETTAQQRGGRVSGVDRFPITDVLPASELTVVAPLATPGNDDLLELEGAR